MNTIIMNLAAAKVPEDKIRFFSYADFGLPLYGHCLFTTDEFAEKNPKVLTAVVKGVVRGMRAMLDDPKGAVAVARRRDPLLDPPIEERRIQVSADINLATPAIKKNGYGYVEIKRLSDTIDDVGKMYEMKRTVTVDDIYTGKFLPPRDELKFKP